MKWMNHTAIMIHMDESQKCSLEWKKQKGLKLEKAKPLSDIVWTVVKIREQWNWRDSTGCLPYGAADTKSVSWYHIMVPVLPGMIHQWCYDPNPTPSPSPSQHTLIRERWVQNQSDFSRGKGAVGCWKRGSPFKLSGTDLKCSLQAEWWVPRSLFP